MIHQDADRIYRVVFDALRKTNNRAVVLSGWSKLSRSGADELLSDQ